MACYEGRTVSEQEEGGPDDLLVHPDPVQGGLLRKIGDEGGVVLLDGWIRERTRRDAVEANAVRTVVNCQIP